MFKDEFAARRIASVRDQRRHLTNDETIVGSRFEKTPRIRVAWRAFVSLCLLATASSALAVGYTAENGHIVNPSGQPIQIRGISHFGIGGKTLQPTFLWSMGWREQLAQIKSLGFNAIRVPISPDTLYDRTPVSQLGYFNPNLNPEFVGKYGLQVLDIWMTEANRLGLYLMLDMHSVSNKSAYPTWYLTNSADFGLIYDRQAYTKDDWIRDLVFVAKRYANLSQFFAIDIYNEPNGPVRWNTGDPKNFWKVAAESAAAAILAANPNLLIFVQGTVANNDGRELTGIPINWGENFQPEAYEPLDIPADKLVLSPHTYGPDVYMKSSFSAPNFPANLPANWDILFGQFHPDHPVVIGEWGGHYGTGASGQKDVQWQNAFVDYMLSKGMRDSFYWCYSPNSNGTGGILDDQLNVRTDKMALLRKLWGTSTDSTGAARPQPPPSIKVR